MKKVRIRNLCYASFKGLVFAHMFSVMMGLRLLAKQMLNFY